LAALPSEIIDGAAVAKAGAAATAPAATTATAGQQLQGRTQYSDPSGRPVSWRNGRCTAL
jgi:hypothetical protein